MNEYFHFKQFRVSHKRSSMKVGTDGVLLGSWVNVAQAKTILDIGTGTGVIALMIAQRTSPEICIDAVEMNDEAYLDAEENFSQSPWKNKLTLHHIPIQKYGPQKKYNLIVSNPPYFRNSYKPPDKNRHIARHSDSLSFDDLLQASTRLLQPDGRLAIILPYQEGLLFINLANQYKLYCIRKLLFRSRQHKSIERLLMEFTFSKDALEEKELCLYKGEKGEQWSDEYISLTKEFYLKI